MKLLKSKKAEDAGDISTIPLETLIEVMIIAMVILFSIGYMAFILSDDRLYMNFYSKDISLLQNSIMLTPDNIYYEYYNSNGRNRDGKMNLLDFEFVPFYTTTFSSSSIGVRSFKVTRSYIHLEDQQYKDRVELSYLKPNILYFVKNDFSYQIFDDLKEFYLNNNFVCQHSELRFNPNEQFYINHSSEFSFLILELVNRLNRPYLDMRLNSRYFSSRFDFIQYSRDYLLNNQVDDNYGVFINIRKIDSDDIVNIFSPFNRQGDLGCKLFNNLVNDLNANIDISYIPSNTFIKNNVVKKSSYYFEIEVSENNLNYVIVNLERLIRTR
ncbi:MAG: hypothetical protein ACMXYG_07085 [Candidatus Woesearchaeota archaeon]